MDDGKGLGKAAPLKWMELQRNSFISLSHTMLSLFKLHLSLSHHIFRTCSHKTEPREGPTIIFPRFCLPFKISVARISKQGKLRIVRSLPIHPDTKNPLHRQNQGAQGMIPEAQYSDHIKLGRFPALITHRGKKLQASNCKSRRQPGIRAAA